MAASGHLPQQRQRAPLRIKQYVQAHFKLRSTPNVLSTVLELQAFAHQLSIPLDYLRQLATPIGPLSAPLWLTIEHDSMLNLDLHEIQDGLLKRAIKRYIISIVADEIGVDLHRFGWIGAAHTAVDFGFSDGTGGYKLKWCKVEMEMRWGWMCVAKEVEPGCDGGEWERLESRRNSARVLRAWLSRR